MSLADKHNAAAMREAVKCLMDNLNIHLVQPSELITVNRAELDGMVMVCEKALAAPARNCERFQTWPEAYENYWNEQGDPADWRKLGAWLFATAKEGRGDESPRTGKEAR